MRVDHLDSFSIISFFSIHFLCSILIPRQKRAWRVFFSWKRRLILIFSLILLYLSTNITILKKHIFRITPATVYPTDRFLLPCLVLHILTFHNPLDHRHTLTPKSPPSLLPKTFFSSTVDGLYSQLNDIPNVFSASNPRPKPLINPKQIFVFSAYTLPCFEPVANAYTSADHLFCLCR